MEPRTIEAMARKPTVEPDGAPRLPGVDILRGVAIVGILFMNIGDMGGALWAFYAGDVAHVGWGEADRAVWFGREVFADGTARCLLELLFGAGMVMLAGRLSLTRYYRRNIVLVLIGVLHMAVLLWPGDILHTYGIAAMIAFLFRDKGAKLLLGIGLAMTVAQLIGGGIGIYAVTQERATVMAAESKRVAGQRLTAAEARTLKTNADRLAKSDADAAASAARIAAEDRARTGDFASWTRSAWDTALTIQGKGLELFFVWEAVSTMLIGAALYKWGIIQGARSRAFYLRLTIAGYAIGLGTRTIAALHTMRFGDGPSIDWATSEAARLATTAGHVGAVYLLLATAWGTRLLRPFEAAGKTALSLYILQTIVCVWILYPPQALALYGTQGWAALMTTALIVSIALLWLANRYVARFTIAPVEWAWRSVVEGRRLPFGRRRARDRA